MDSNELQKFISELSRLPTFYTATLQGISWSNSREKQDRRNPASIQPSCNCKPAACMYSEVNTLNLTDDVSLYFIHLDLSRMFPPLSALYYGQLYQE